MLKAAPNFKHSNSSVPEHDPLKAKTDRELEAKLYNQIRPAQSVLILGGMYVAHSKWIQKEIDIANSMGKPIIGIRPRGSEMVPVAVKNSAKELVGWNTPSIVDAIRRNSL